MSEKRICKYCGMDLSEDVPHGLRECHLRAVARIAELKGMIEILEDQQREAKNHLIDKNLHIDSLYDEGYKLQQRIAELEAAQRWIPVSERLPDGGHREFYEVACIYQDFGELALFSKGRWVIYEGASVYDITDSVVFWRRRQPLPAEVMDVLNKRQELQ